MTRKTTRSTRLRSCSLVYAALALTALGSVGAARAQTAVFTPLGDLPGGEFYSVANGVSADGKVVVGRSESGDPLVRKAFRWTQATGMVNLGVLPGATKAFSNATAASGDGSVVVGGSESPLGAYEAFRWTAQTGLVGLGDLPGGRLGSGASGVSLDGSVVVGSSSSAASQASRDLSGEAFRWTAATGMVGLGDLPGGFFFSGATGVSADGKAVSGTGSSDAFYNGEGFYWTTTAGFTPLNGLRDERGNAIPSEAYAVSGDGLVVVGKSFGEIGYEPFIWTPAAGMIGIGSPPNYSSGPAALGVSHDGSVVVGESEGYNHNGEAFFWTAATGSVRLGRYLLDNFASSLPANFNAWRLTRATGVSADGSVICGDGIDPNGKTQAWMVRLPVTVTPKWTPVDVAVNRTDNTSRLLWRQNTGRYAVWRLAANGTVLNGKSYSPPPGCSSDQIVVAPNGQTTIFWKNPHRGNITLWTLAPDLSSVVKATRFVNPDGYTPQNLAADASGNLRLTLRRTNGQVVFWTIRASDGVVTGTSGLYGPYANLQDGPIAVGADGRLRLLWRNVSTGGATLWTIPSGYGVPSSGFNYNPVAGARPADIAVGIDNKTRLQWAYSSGADAGKIALWKIDTTAGGTGAIEVGKFFGPYPGVSPLGLSVGGDNETRQLWRYDATGKTALWKVNNPLTSITDADTYGPIP